MTRLDRRRWIWGHLCVLALVGSAFIPNPIYPDVCTSRGRGLPFAVHVDWCECFSESQPHAFRPLGMLSNGAFWALVFVLGARRLKKDSRRDGRPDASETATGDTP